MIVPEGSLSEQRATVRTVSYRGLSVKTLARGFSNNLVGTRLLEAARAVAPYWSGRVRGKNVAGGAHLNPGKRMGVLTAVES